MKKQPRRAMLGLGAAALLAVGLLTAASAADEQPREPRQIVKEATQKVLDILRDPELQGEDKKKEQRRNLRKAVSNTFDWRLMARSALAQHWRDRTEKEKKEFVELFRRLLEDTYLKRIRKNAGAELRYDEQEIRGRYARVSTVAITEDDTKVPIKYRMKRVKQDEREKNPKLPAWQVYDVNVEGVSLINNYRAQFRDILVGGSYEELVEKLRAKVNKNSD